MIIIHVIINANNGCPIIRLPVRRDRRHREWDSVAVDETREARRRIGPHPESLEGERVCASDGLQRIEPPPHLKSAEVKQLVGNDRTADAGAELMLRIPLAERRRRRLIRRELEMRIAESVAE